MFVGSSVCVWSQTKDEVIQDRIEFIAQDLDAEEISLEDIFEILNRYYDHKLNLNSATKEELQQLMMISDIQINALLKYRAKNGLFSTLYQVKDVAYWDLITLERIIPFVRVSEVQQKKKGNFKQYLKEGEFEAYFRFIQTIEKQAGYAHVSDAEKENSSQYYWGSPAKVYSRLKYTHGNDLSIGVTMEKDPGEAFFGAKERYGFDFYSAHAYYDNGNNSFFRKAVIGDYRVQIGQGLAMWTGYGFSKTASATSTKKNGHGLRPYSSTDESRFMRGAGVELGVGDFSLTMWGSYKGVDGSLDEIDTITSEAARYASSINLTGYHRTTSELDRKNSVKELIYGANLKYEIRNLQIGITAVHQGYNTFFQRSDRLANRYRFSGKNLVNLSADYAYVFRNLSLFGEVAQSRDSKAVAFMQGLNLALGRRAAIAAIYRHYPKDYHTFYAQGFGDGSNTNNESGFYIGGKFNITKQWRINAYVDFFKSTWAKFRVDGPSHGNEVLGQLTYHPNSRFETYFRFREKNKMQNVSSDVATGNLRPIEFYKQRKYQLGLTTDLGNGWRWRSRIDYVTDQRESKGFHDGWALTQDVLYRPDNFPLQVTLRYAIFNTDNYDARIYSYEYNMENVFSIPVYYGSGSRAYVLLRYTFFKGHCDLWLRYAIFVYNQKGRISSGPNEIIGNVKSQFGAQLRIRF